MVTESEILRIVDTIHRDKNIDKEIVFRGIEAALISAAKKHYGQEEGIHIEIDRQTGAVTANKDDEPIHPGELGRIAAQVAKQIIAQKIREAERDVIFTDFEARVGSLVAGSVQRVEGPNIIVNLGRAEGFLPRHEQIFTENYKPGDRIRAIVIEVRKVGSRVRIILSRTHPDFVRRLFELEVPEITEKHVQIRGLAREAGYRTKIAVASDDPKIDPVGACVGVRGSRIKSVVEELNGEKIDIVRWSSSIEEYVVNALKPAAVEAIKLDEEVRRAFLLVPDDQLALAIGKKGQNVRLASKLTGLELDVTSPSEVAAAETLAESEAQREGASKEEAEGEHLAESTSSSEEEQLSGKDDPPAESPAPDV